MIGDRHLAVLATDPQSGAGTALVPDRPAVAVRVRVEWENDGEEWVEATAT